MALFDRARLVGSKPRSIVVETHRPSRVVNEVGFDEVRVDQQRKFEGMTREHPMWTVRRPPTGRYNCAGHVWAARRTAIYEDTEWRKIFADDGYRVTQLPDVQVGDLVVYSWPEAKSFLHVGEVVELRRLMERSVPVAWVLSKLDSTSGEVVHAVEDLPYRASGITFEYEYWTERGVVERRSA